ncbi:MAG: DUF480 domain-containing protein, partial [Peristeroidobacter soli]
VPKYQQLFCNTEFGSLKFTPQETAIICELLLRGPQTPGELRARVPRMADLPDPEIVESLLEGLAARAEGALVQQLAREAGRRDSRWAQLFEELPASLSAAPAESAPASSASAPSSAAAPRVGTQELAARVALLEQAVAELREELVQLKSRG